MLTSARQRFGLFFLLCFVSLTVQQNTIVKTAQGSVQGVVVGEVIEFLGVPFAAPPVGNLRWRSPQDHASWAPSVLDATQFKSQCMQTAIGYDFPVLTVNNTRLKVKALTESEDCLYLNIYTPLLPKQLPVMVFIHGGAYEVGNAVYFGYELLSPEHIVEIAENIIVVTIQYRLGPLGFLYERNLAKQEATMGTLGIQDQQAALRWVNLNIANFGGDPNSVTIAGESAGGGSVLIHGISPKSWPYFHRIIAESAWIWDFPHPTPAQALSTGDTFTSALGCSSSSDVAACLRAIPATSVVAAIPTKGAFLLGEGWVWTPVVDGVIVPDSPLKLYYQQKFKMDSLLIGTNLNEGTLFTYLGYTASLTPSTYLQAVSDKWGTLTQEIVYLYPTNYEMDGRVPLSNALGHASFQCPMRIVANAVSSKVPTYAYLFAEPYSTTSTYGVSHGMELFFVFDIPLSTDPFTTAQSDLSGVMISYWSSFVANGIPSCEYCQAWPKYSSSFQVRQVLVSTGVFPDTTFSNDTSSYCDFWTKNLLLQ